MCPYWREPHSIRIHSLGNMLDAGPVCCHSRIPGRSTFVEVCVSMDCGRQPCPGCGHVRAIPSHVAPATFGDLLGIHASRSTSTDKYCTPVTRLPSFSFLRVHEILPESRPCCQKPCGSECVGVRHSCGDRQTCQTGPQGTHCKHLPRLTPGCNHVCRHPSYAIQQC